MELKRCLLEAQKGIFGKPKDDLFEAKRPCVCFDVCENNLQISISLCATNNLCVIFLQDMRVFLQHV